MPSKTKTPYTCEICNKTLKTSAPSLIKIHEKSKNHLNGGKRKKLTKEDKNQISRKYYKENKKTQLVIRKKYREEHKKEIKENREKYYKKNKKSILKRMKGLRGRYSAYKCGAKKRKLKWELTLEQFDMITKKENCYLCGNYFNVCGVDRVYNQQGYKIGNTLPCCFNCNISKHTTSLREHYEMCRDTYKNLKDLYENN